MYLEYKSSICVPFTKQRIEILFIKKLVNVSCFIHGAFGIQNKKHRISYAIPAKLFAFFFKFVFLTTLEWIEWRYFETCFVIELVYQLTFEYSLLSQMNNEIFLFLAHGAAAPHCPEPYGEQVNPLVLIFEFLDL